MLRSSGAPPAHQDDELVATDASGTPSAYPEALIAFSRDESLIDDPYYAALANAMERGEDADVINGMVHEHRWWIAIHGDPLWPDRSKQARSARRSNLSRRRQPRRRERRPRARRRTSASSRTSSPDPGDADEPAPSHHGARLGVAGVGR